MKITKNMYMELFNGITDAHKKLKEAMKILEEAQIKAEDEYINEEEINKEG